MSDYSGSNLSSLKRRLAALFAVIAAAVIAGAIAYNSDYRASLVKDSEKLLLSIEEFKIQQITYWRNDRRNDTNSLLDSPILSPYMRRFAADPKDAIAKSVITARIGTYVKNNRYTEAAMVDSAGRVLAASGIKVKKAYPEAKELIKKAASSGQPEMGDLYIAPGDKGPNLDMAAPAVKGPAGKNLFLLLRIDPRDYLYPLIEKWPTNSRTGETLLAAREGDRIVYISELRHHRGAAMKLQLPAASHELPAAIAFTGKTGIVRGRDYRGVEVLAAVNTIPGTNWAIVTKLDMDEVLAGSGRVSLLLMLLALSLLGTAGAGAYLVFRRQAEEYRRSYAELDRRTSALKDNYARLTAQANDAIIIADAQTLRIIETNKKSHEVYGYTEEEFQRLKLTDLVPESGLARQRERVEAVRSGPGAVIEAEHKRKNGELFPAEISSSCTSGSGREFIFAIVRDLSERMRMEQALRDSEENYRQLFEAESDAILLIDNENGELKQANNAAAALYGYTHEELLAMRNTDLSAEPEDTSRVTRTTPLDAGKVVVIPLRYHRKKSGEVFPVEITGRFFTRNGRPVHIVAIRDITDRKKAGERLRLGEERLRMAAEGAQFGVYAYDIGSGVRSYSTEFLKLFGLQPETELPLDPDGAPKALYPDDRAGFLAARRAGYDPAGTGLVDHEFRIILPTGPVRWLRVRGRTLFTGTGAGSRPLRANGIIQDITDAKQAELTLRVSEEKYRSLFENMLNGLAYCRMLYDGDTPEDFIYLEVNGAFEKLTGLKNVTGKRVSEVIPGIRDSDKELFDIYGRVARTGKPEIFETWLESLKMWFSISVYSPARDHFAAVFDVITERKQAEQALRESESAVRNKLNAIMTPEGDIGTLELTDIFDIPALQLMMDELYSLTNITSAILDLDGKVLVASGWQDICTKFHRVNKETCRHCLESDTALNSQMAAGQVKSYFCKNNMRDIATPLMVGNRHVGNFFLGQFLYEDDPRNYETFRAQARRYGFDEKEYLAAYDRVPVFSREKVEVLIKFYSQVTELVSSLSYGKIKLARALAQSERSGELLRENERRLAALFSNLPGIAYRCLNNRDWTMEFISEGCKELTGYEAAELTGRNALSFNQLIVPADRDRVWTEIETALSENRNFQLTYEIRRKDGELRTVWEQGLGVKGPDGKVVALEGFISDITERRLAELALEKLNRDLIEKKQEMENFLYITTHDLRGPLVNIQGFSQNLEHYLTELKASLEAADLPAEPKETLEKLTGDSIPTALRFILGSSRKMDALITALLKVSRLGRVEMKPEDIEMNGLVDKVIESLRYQLGKAGGEIKHSDLPRCKADPGAVSQLFANLLDNAIKYRQEGRPLEIHMTGEIKDGAALYCVRDNGSGIPEKDLGRIWDIFYRHESSSGSNGEGIGLPMVKRIAEKNGGNITVNSTLGQGSEFCVSLPLAEAK